MMIPVGKLLATIIFLIIAANSGKADYHLQAKEKPIKPEYMPVYGSEPVMREGRMLDVTTSANYGYTIGKPIVFGYLPLQEFEHTEFTVEVFGEVVPAIRHDGPLYDPNMERLKL